MNNIKEITEEVKDINTKQLDNNWNIDEFKGKRIMTFGTFDLLHIGHVKIIDHAVDIAGSNDNVVIGVSSDR